MELLEKLPDQILSWQLKGQGLENLGTKGRPDSVPFPSFTEENIIVRIDAVGLCFSDIKLITAGSGHPRMVIVTVFTWPLYPSRKPNAN